jgi:hypothetical protein
MPESHSGRCTTYLRRERNAIHARLDYRTSPPDVAGRKSTAQPHDIRSEGKRGLPLQLQCRLGRIKPAPDKRNTRDEPTAFSTAPYAESLQLRRNPSGRLLQLRAGCATLIIRTSRSGKVKPAAYDRRPQPYAGDIPTVPSTLMFAPGPEPAGPAANHSGG